jgi:hypothetical protein
MMRHLVIVATALLTACVGWPRQPLTEEERESIASAEAFVARNGYTAAGHPNDLPVQNAEVLDSVATAEQLIEWRWGTLSSRAFGIVPAATDAYYVLFDRLPSGGGESDEQRSGARDFRAVLVQHMQAVQVVHSVLLLSEGDWKPNDR